MGWRFLLWVAWMALLAIPTTLHAGEPEREWEHERAKKLFETALELMDRKSYTTACPMLEESLRLDPGMGTKYYLSRCYEQTDRLASAYRLLLQVAADADLANQPKREKHARKRAAALQPRLSHLTIRVPKKLASSRDLVLTIDGKGLRRGKWGKAVPVDLGEHEVKARQRHSRLAWQHKVWVTREGEAAAVSVPELASLMDPQSLQPAAPEDQRASAAAPDERGAPAEGRSTAGSGGMDGMLIGGIVSALGAAVAVGVFNWAWTDAASIDDDDQLQAYREDLSESQDACDAADDGETHGGVPAQPISDMCKTGHTREIIQAVSLASSIGLSALALALIVSSDTVTEDDEPSDVDVAVQLGEASGAVTLRYRF